MTKLKGKFKNPKGTWHLSVLDGGRINFALYLKHLRPSAVHGCAHFNLAEVNQMLEGVLLQISGTNCPVRLICNLIPKPTHWDIKKAEWGAVKRLSGPRKK